eukprot:8686637-Karenia_brevis.AAC.1
MQEALPEDVEYNIADCMRICPRSFQPCMRKDCHYQTLVCESIMPRSEMMQADRYTPQECLMEAALHDYTE